MNNGKYAELFTGFRGEEGELIPMLQKLQEEEGYISEEGVHEISRFLKMTENHIFGVASFYAQFRFTKPGRHTVKVCMGTTCHVRGGHMVSDAVGRELGIEPGETTEDGRFDFQRVACLGCCALSPVVQVDDDVYGQVSVTRLKQILGKYK